jgi:hypothetical protein
LYTETGYRYKWSDRIHSDAALGIGYMHVIPATSVFKLNKQGEYKNSKGIGRPQAIASISLGSGYIVNRSKPRPVTIFTIYQQRLQFPFVKSYVPLLPYNSILFGAGIKLKKISQ